MINKLIKSDKEEENVLPFIRPASTGGDEDWLRRLENGTCFLARDKNDRTGEFVAEHHKVHQAGKTAFIVIHTPLGQTLRVHADTLRFSRKNELVEVLGVTHPDTTEEDKDNVPTGE